MKEKVLVVASAGGHLTQAMCATANCENIILVSNKINLSDARIKKAYKIMDTQHNAFIHIINLFFALYLLIKERPKAVFSTGGPIVLPFALLCKILPIKFVFLDTLSRVVELSNTGKLLKRYHLYNAFFSQWEAIAKSNNVDYIGKCFDILGEHKDVKEPEYITLTDSPLVLVTIGTNQYSFPRALRAISQMSLYSDERVQWLIQAGDNQVDILPANGRVVTLVNRDEMESYVRKASLVISHCGIGSINQMLSYKKKVIFIPRVARLSEFSDDHQLQIASQLNNPKFDVINPDEPLPDVSYEELSAEKLVKAPVNITNYTVANKIEEVLSL
ncbi:MAG: glycosyltransferase [Cellvibrionaceae bacterium]